MNSLSNSTQVSRSRRESQTTSSKENKDFFKERQSYIAECKRLLSDLRGCQSQEKQEPTSLNEIRVELPVNEESKTFEGIEVLEKYLNEFDALYNMNKSELYSKLKEYNNFEGRK